MLRHPWAGGVGGDAGQMHPPALHLDDEQDVETGQTDGLHSEEVARQQSASLGGEELRPRRAAPAGCRAEPVPAQDPANGGCRHPYAESAALAHDPHISPPWVLPSQAQHQLDYLLVEAGSAATGGRVGPAAGDQLSMPAQQRRRGDQERRPPLARQELGQRGQ